MDAKLPKVLVATPIYSVMKYCFKEFSANIKALSYANYDVLLVDNSRENDFYEEIKKEEGIKVIRDDSDEKTNLKRLVRSRNLILDYAKKQNYDFVLMMDADVIPPKDIIQELLKHKKDIISGLYKNYFMVSGEAKSLYVAWLYFSEEEFKELKEKYNLPETIKTRFDLRRHMTEDEANSNEVIEVLYPAAGCMLISGACFSVARYGIVETSDNFVTSDDIYFINDARKNGFRVYANTKVKCEHLIEGKFDKDSKGNFLHPMYKS